MRGELVSAAADLYILLSRGYTRPQVANAIRNRWGLSSEEWSVVSRCVHSAEKCLEHRVKLVRAEDVEGSILIVDGYNQLSVVASALTGLPVFKCLDGIVRDAALGRVKRVASRYVDLLVNAVRRLHPSKCIVLLDSSIPGSGRLAARLRREGILAATSRFTDKSLLGLAQRYAGSIVASSDIVVVEGVEYVFDLADYILVELLGLEPPDLQLAVKGIIEKLYGELLRGLGLEAQLGP